MTCGLGMSPRERQAQDDGFFHASQLQETNSHQPVTTMAMHSAALGTICKPRWSSADQSPVSIVCREHIPRRTVRPVDMHAEPLMRRVSAHSPPSMMRSRALGQLPRAFPRAQSV